MTLENKGLLVLLLAIGTICAYVGLACWGGMEIHDEKKRKNKSEKNTPKEDKVEASVVNFFFGKACIFVFVVLLHIYPLVSVRR